MNSSPSLTTQQSAALRIAYGIRLNIRLNWNRPCFHAIASRLWNEADKLNADRATAYAMVQGALQLLG